MKEINCQVPNPTNPASPRMESHILRWFFANLLYVVSISVLVSALIESRFQFPIHLTMSAVEMGAIIFSSSVSIIVIEIVWPDFFRR